MERFQLKSFLSGDRSLRLGLRPPVPVLPRPPRFEGPAALLRPDERDALLGLADRFDTCWNARDPAALVSLFAEKGGMRFATGRCCRGGEALVQRYTRLFRLLPRSLRHVTRIGAVRLSGPRLATCDAQGDIVAPSWRGGDLLLHSLSAKVTVARKGNAWRILSIRLSWRRR